MHPHYFFPFFIILVVATVSKADKEQDSICPPTEFICGDFTNISYPFSVGDGTAKCSYCGFELYCHNDYPVIYISSKKYRVKSIDYSSQTLIIVDTSIIGNNCRPLSANSELDFSIFTYADNDVNLTLYYNCPDEISNSDLHSVSCLRNDANFSYYTTQASTLYPYLPMLRNCSVSFFTLLDSAADLLNNNSLNFEDAMDEGFNVSWIINYGKCENCVNSGGNCSYDPIVGDESICYCGNGHSPQKCPSRRKKIRTIAIAVGVCGGFLVVAICITAFLCYRKKQRTSSTSKFISRTISSDPSYDSELGKGNSILPTHVFSYEELQEATNNFDESKQLGEGGFGTVYHGKLRDGRTVAVKRLYESNYRRVEQFMNEVEILSRLRHPNLVSLYGCTSRHSRELLLVYEFVPNGTVADHIHGDHAKSRALTWPIRMSIAIESADALAYLHAVDIIHRDVKTNNILLDTNFHVKVADFGLSRLFPLDKTHVSTAPQGTPGYVDPDYHRCYQLNDKSDVYSFGVVLFELVSSKPAVDITRHRHEINLSNMAITKIQNHALYELVDPSFGFETDSAVRREITLVAELAFRCLHDEKDTRPSMDEVFTVLREIQSEKINKDKVNLVDSQMDDDAIPLKEIPPLSPNSVTMPWVSSTTTPNTSG